MTIDTRATIAYTKVTRRGSASQKLADKIFLTMARTSTRVDRAPQPVKDDTNN